MDLPPLFLEKATSHVKEASYRLGHDVSTWEQDIVEKLHEEHSYLPDYNIKVVMNRTDDVTGTGTGQITVDEQIRIPVVIKAFKLQPLDLMFYNEELLPVTKASIENIVQDGSFGKAIKPIATGVDMGIRAAVQAPHYGKYAYASALDYTSEDLAEVFGAAYSEDGLRYDIQDSKYLKDCLSQYVLNAGVIKEAEEVKPQVTLRLLKEAQLKDIKTGGVRTPNGSGTLFKLATIDGSLKDTSLYIGESGEYAFAQSVPGYETNVKVASIEPKGDGVFYAMIGTQPICTEPLTIHYKTAEYISASTVLGEKIKIYQDSAFAGFKKIAESVYLSNVWEFTPLTKKATFSSASDINKLAALGADFIVRRVGNHYLIEGDLSQVPEIAKLADTPVTRYEMQNGFTAYCTPDEFDDVVRQADEAIAAKIKTYAPDPKTGEMLEVPKLAQADRAALLKSAGILSESIVKQAGVGAGEAEQTVDAILGLNFLNQQNIYKLIESVDDLQVARAVLSRVLLAGRMGLDVDVSTIRTAVFALDAVIKDLRRLRQTHLNK